MRNPDRAVFKTGSVTFYWSSKFFPKAIRQDVTKLYSFVRVADDYVDATPARINAFEDLCQTYQKAHTGQKQSETVHDRLAANMADLAERYNFDKQWIADFLKAMESDLHPTLYETLHDTLEYVHGSAEVVGLMMSRIMGLPQTLDQTAMLQGRAFQWINFIRDIKEDNTLGRCYFPQSDLRRFNLPDLSPDTLLAHPEAFKRFVKYEIDRYDRWQKVARGSYEQLPRRFRAPLQTAARLFDWTAQQIVKDPFSVLEQKIKPSKTRVLKTGLIALWTK